MSFLKKIKRKIAKLIYARRLVYRNVEGDKNYNFSLECHGRPHGLSAFIRAKNEESKIEMCIRSIYNVFDEIIFVDNESTDSTLKIVESLKEEIDKKDSIKIFRYPFSVSRCGQEHGDTDENSVHSLVYYYNWCLSKAAYNYVVKWDADMYLREEAGNRFRSFLMERQNKDESLIVVPIQTVYIGQNGEAYAAVEEVNKEYRAFPNRPYIRYYKDEHWEALATDFYIPVTYYPHVEVYEIKDTRENEFDHWTGTDFPTERKRKEWESYNKILNGDVESGEFREIGLI